MRGFEGGHTGRRGRMKGCKERDRLDLSPWAQVWPALETCFNRSPVYLAHTGVP